MEQNDIFKKIEGFLKELGIDIVEKELDDSCILPGLSLYKNSILIDKNRLKYVGDILHEAGHIAVTPEENRMLIGTEEMDTNWPYDGDEMIAILWSYAAARHLDISPEVIFHKDGYKNESKEIMNRFENGNYVGLPLFEWMGFCDEGEFPKIKRWMRR